MENKMESLYGNEVWDLVELPPQRKTVGSKQVCTKSRKKLMVLSSTTKPD